MSDGIRTHKLTKRYAGNVLALAELDLDVAAGEIFGLLGPNGAGKTTAVRILTTILRPSSGTASVGGYDVRKQPAQVRQRIGVVAQNACLDCMLTAYDNLDFYAKIHGLRGAERAQRLREAFRWANLDGKERHLVDSFSGGMKRKLDLARVMMLSPQFVFLDEPTAGLDPASRRSVWDMVGEMKARGCTVILTTHYMEEADRLCDRLAILHRGRKVAEGAPHEIRSQVSGKSSLEVHAPNLTDAMLIPLVRAGEIEKYVIVGNYHQRIARLYLDDAVGKMPYVLNYLHDHGVTANAVTVQGPTLEDAFINLTGMRIEA
ncbi:MAG TPA: ABC transporter ATP-binding protein [Anaerolineae bacterium]|nr:ABC transporter ATP-binding protein [Anaerolineae bacterium]